MYFIIAGTSFFLILVLSLLGESTLPLFGGNKDLAARFYKVIFMLLGGGLLAGLTSGLIPMMARFLKYLNSLVPNSLLKSILWLTDYVQPIQLILFFLFIFISVAMAGFILWEHTPD
jgi:hypothetical protein